jgi:hypothetical protein
MYIYLDLFPFDVFFYYNMYFLTNARSVRICRWPKIITKNILILVKKKLSDASSCDKPGVKIYLKISKKIYFKISHYCREI